MFGRKELEEKINRQSDKIFDLTEIVKQLCPHDNVYINTTTYFDGYSERSVRCKLCDCFIKRVDEIEANEIMKQQEVKKAKELLKQVEEENKGVK